MYVPVSVLVCMHDCQTTREEMLAIVWPNTSSGKHHPFDDSASMGTGN